MESFLEIGKKVDNIYKEFFFFGIESWSSQRENNNKREKTYDEREIYIFSCEKRTS